MQVQYRAKTACVIQGQFRAEGEEFSLPEIVGGHKHLEVIGASNDTPEAPSAPLKTTDDVAAAPASTVFKVKKASKADKKTDTSFLG